MSKLDWGKAGSRLYETGIDRGVLYLRSSTPVPWVGLTGLEEDFGEDQSEPVYFDGLKIRDDFSIGDFSGTLSAFTYPDEFAALEGIGEVIQGFYADDQPTGSFNLTFRTLIGNDLDDTAHGYKIHIIYNVVVVPAARTRETHTEEIAPQNFSWGIAATPVDVPNYRPTAHFILDSSEMDPGVLAVLESYLYGTDRSDPILPSLELMLGLVTTNNVRRLVLGGLVGTVALAASGYTEYDLAQGNVPGIFFALTTSRLYQSELDPAGLYRLEA